MQKLRSYKISSPLSVPLSRVLSFPLNLNRYRSANHFTLSKAKKNYFALMSSKINSVPRFDKCTIEYVVYHKTKGRFDLGNVVAVHKKFFEDSLVKMKKIEDDDYLHVICSSERFGAVDKENPRVEIIVTEVI